MSSVSHAFSARELVDARVRRSIGDATKVVQAIYGRAADELVEQCLALVHKAADERGDDLVALDLARSLDPTWFQQPDRVGYVAYVDRFAGSLQGVATHLDYLRELDVTYLHLMKVIKPRPAPNDGGFAVVDYCDVDPALGTWADLVALTKTLRDNGISLCLDLVMNHTAAEHTWAVEAKAGSAKHRDYFLVFPDRTQPDAYEATLPEVFPTLAPGNFTWDDDLDGWVWTTFNTYQWDLNWANPEVFAEMLGVMLTLANAGVEILRLDAIAFTWKRVGTNCQNQPEAHLIAQALRAFVEMAAPAVLLKAEAIVPPNELVPYLGAYARERDECHLAYHNQLMVMLWSSLATRDARLASQAMSGLPATPVRTSFATYVRCHDDIGWAVDDADAAAIGIGGQPHREYLASFYRGDFFGSYARGAAFSSNPENNDERTSGTAAALCGIVSARARNDVEAVDLAVRRLLLAHGVALAFGGIPLLYMGDEVALDNDTTYLDDPALADDSRWMHRPWMDWDTAARRTVAGTVEHRVFTGLQRLIAARLATPALATGGQTWVHHLDAPSVFAWARSHPRHGRMYGLANFSDRPAGVPREALGWAGLPDTAVDALGFVEARVTSLRIELAPLGQAWFTEPDAGLVLPRAPAN
jgi:amylosucrase